MGQSPLLLPTVERLPPSNLAWLACHRHVLATYRPIMHIANKVTYILRLHSGVFGHWVGLTFEIGFFSLERCGLRPPQGKGGAFPLWGGREIQNPVSDRHPVGHLGPQLAGIRYLGSQKGVKKVCLGLEGSSTARHLGPPPRIDLKFGSMDACRSRTARSRRVLRSWPPLGALQP